MQKFGFLSQKSSFKNFVTGLFVFNTYADEISSSGDVPSAPSNSPAPEVVNYEKLIAKARQEEKDKLYGDIQRLKQENELLTKQANESLLRAGKAEQELENLQKNSTSNEEVTKLKAEIEALKEENKKIKESTPDEKKLREELTKEFEVKAYITEKLNENKGKILSVYASQVTGATKAEVDAAIKKAIEQSDEIRKEIGVTNSPDQQQTTQNVQQTSQTQQQPSLSSGYSALFGQAVQQTGVMFPPTMPPAPNPSSNSNNGVKLDANYITNLDVKSEEYKKFRQSIGLK